MVVEVQPHGILLERFERGHVDRFHVKAVYKEARRLFELIQRHLPDHLANGGKYAEARFTASLRSLPLLVALIRI